MGRSRDQGLEYSFRRWNFRGPGIEVELELVETVPGKTLTRLADGLGVRLHVTFRGFSVCRSAGGYDSARFCEPSAASAMRPAVIKEAMTRTQSGTRWPASGV